MEQKKIVTKKPSNHRERASVSALHGGSTAGFLSEPGELEKLTKLVLRLSRNGRGELPTPVRRSLGGEIGLKRLVTAMTILRTDHGETSPAATCTAISVAAPDLYDGFGTETVRALCEQIQHAEVAEQSVLFQEKFQLFNVQYFRGRLPEYRIHVVFDVLFWETERCGYSLPFPAPVSPLGFIDFKQQQIFIRFRTPSADSTMPGTLIHEMARAATDGGHNDNWIREIARLEAAGAPVDSDDRERVFQFAIDHGQFSDRY